MSKISISSELRHDELTSQNNVVQGHHKDKKDQRDKKWLQSARQGQDEVSNIDLMLIGCAFKVLLGNILYPIFLVVSTGTAPRSFVYKVKLENPERCDIFTVFYGSSNSEEFGKNV